MRIPKSYEAGTLEGLFTSVGSLYRNGWNEGGVPADFVFDDGVTLTYDEAYIDDPDDFASVYREQIGYRDSNGSADDIFTRGGSSGCVFEYTLDFSEKLDLLKLRNGTGIVTVTELQVDDGAGPIAGNVVVDKNLNKTKLQAWIKAVINSGQQVERASSVGGRTRDR